MMPKSQGEAFCDGVFAVAITLLFLESKVPDGRLAHELVPQRPSFTSYGVSFLFIGIIWVNHHAVSRYVLRVNRVLLFLNLGLLMAVSVLPLPTALLARYVRDGGTNAHVAAFVYCLTITFQSIIWSTLWWYLTHHPDVHQASIGPNQAHAISRQGLTGSMVYAAMGVAWLSAPLTLAVFAALAVFWAAFYRPESQARGSIAGE